MIGEDTAHRLGGDAAEVGAVLPGDVPLVREAEVKRTRVREMSVDDMGAGENRGAATLH